MAGSPLGTSTSTLLLPLVNRPTRNSETEVKKGIRKKKKNKQKTTQQAPLHKFKCRN